jgi:hypothetical protein
LEGEPPVSMPGEPVPRGRAAGVGSRAVDPKALQNRLVIATGMWRETTDEPLPRMPPGRPAEQIEGFELRLVDLLCREATPENAREVADRTWDLVHDRPDEDPVKRRVVECHETLARLGAAPPSAEG